MKEGHAGPELPKREAWHSRSAEDALARLRSRASGLTSEEATRRLAANGPNEIEDARPTSPLRIAARQFKSLIIWVLIVAGLISGLLGEALDAAVISFIVALNAAIGFYQELNAEKAVAALKKMTAPHAVVCRGGANASVLAREVVAGDVLVLAAGDLIAADARLLEAASLTCIEAPLTGESAAVPKQINAVERVDVPLGDRDDMVFTGTSIATGTGRAVVVATGMQTELGRIAALIEKTRTDASTPLQTKLDSFGKVLVKATLGIVVALFVLGLVRGMRPVELFLTSVSLAVAAVPEGLPAVVTVALALGVLRMSRRRALVRKLPAVETLGATTVICTDKTGTLTVGQMTARMLYVAGRRYEVTGEGYGPTGEVRFAGRKADADQAAQLAELATTLLGCNAARIVNESGSWKSVGDPTEGALLVAAGKAGGDRESFDQEHPKEHELPFDAERKRSSMVRAMPGGQHRAFVMGAPGALLERCTQVFTATGVRPLTSDGRQSILDETSAMAKNALRVLASAYGDLGDAPLEDLDPDSVEQRLVFVGLAGMMDPPRAEAKAAIADCRGAGIRVVMITGDHPETAAAIARDLGIVSATAEVVSGANLDEMSEAALLERAPNVAVYARVTAEHKLRIVRALRANGEIVAMTGDGVNDAPAIKGADIGIAMGKSGTEVTKQAADVIITDDNFATIVAAVEEGRGIYDNIRKTLQYLLAGNSGELMLVAACVVVGLPMPLLPIQLLWVNLVSDGLPAICLATDPIHADVMKRQPRPAGERITNAAFLRAMFLTGFLTAAVSFATYAYLIRTETTAMARTCAFAVLVFAELLRAFGARSETEPIWRLSLLTNVPLVLVIVGTFGLQVLSQQSAAFGRLLKTTPVSFGHCLVLLAIGAVPALIVELVKAARLVTTRKKRGTRPS